MTTANIERWRGRPVWRTPVEVAEHERYKADRALLGRRVEVSTRRGTRRHICTVVAVYRPTACVDWKSHKGCRPGGLEWASALSRVAFESSRYRSSAGIVLRIDASTAPNMVGRYLSHRTFRVLD
jgi:hypothetical protein